MRASRHSRKSGSSYQPDDCPAIAGGDGRQIRSCEISCDVRRLHAGRHHRSGRTRNLFCVPGCAVEAAISLIDGKWKCPILFHILDGTARFDDRIIRHPQRACRAVASLSAASRRFASPIPTPDRRGSSRDCSRLSASSAVSRASCAFASSACAVSCLLCASPRDRLALSNSVCAWRSVRACPATRGGELLDARSPKRSGFELTQFGVDGTVGASVVATEAANPIHLLGTLQARAQNAFSYRS